MHTSHTLSSRTKTPNKRIRVLLIERVHCLVSVPFFVLYAILILVALLVGIFAGPDTFKMEHSPSITFEDNSAHHLPDLSLFNGTHPLGAATTIPLSNLNQQLGASLHLYKNHYWQNMSISKTDLSYNVAFYGRQDPASERILLNVPAIPHRARLHCRQHTERCDSINVAFTSTVQYGVYEVEVTLNNADELIVDLAKTHFPPHFNSSHNTTYTPLVSMLKGEAHFTWFTYNPAYTNFSLGWRYSLLIFSLPFTVFYFVFSLILTELKYWSMEQWWVGFLLIILNLYNNPFYALEISDMSFLLTFLNTIFVALFMCYMLLTVLIVVHGAIKRPQDRSLLFFYTPKIILVGGVFVVLLFFFIFAAFRQSLDPAYSAYDDVNGNQTEYEYLGVFLIVALVIYLLSLLYYLARGIGMWRRGSLKPTRRNRFWIILGFTLIMLVFTVSDAVSLMWFSRDAGRSSGSFLIFFLIYNGYSLIMGVFHLPTLKTKKKKEIHLEEDAIAHEENAAFYAQLEEDETIVDNNYADYTPNSEKEDAAGSVEQEPAGPENLAEDGYDSFQENRL